MGYLSKNSIHAQFVHLLLSKNLFKLFPIIVAHPPSNLDLAKCASSGKLSSPVWVSLSLVLSPSGNNSNITSDKPNNHHTYIPFPQSPNRRYSKNSFEYLILPPIISEKLLPVKEVIMEFSSVILNGISMLYLLVSSYPNFG